MLQEPTYKQILEQFPKLPFKKISNKFISDFNLEMEKNSEMIPKDYLKSESYKKFIKNINSTLFNLVSKNYENEINQSDWDEWFKVTTTMNLCFDYKYEYEEFFNWLRTNPKVDFHIRFTYGQWSNKNVSNKNILNTEFETQEILDKIQKAWIPKSTYDMTNYPNYSKNPFLKQEIKSRDDSGYNSLPENNSECYELKELPTTKKNHQVFLNN